MRIYLSSGAPLKVKVFQLSPPLPPAAKSAGAFSRGVEKRERGGRERERERERPLAWPYL